LELDEGGGGRVGEGGGRGGEGGADTEEPKGEEEMERRKARDRSMRDDGNLW
jgi:hypothetical protein